MPPGRCVTIEHDAYYRDQKHLTFDERTKVNYDHPASLESSLLAMIEPVLSPIWVLLATGEKPSAMAALGGAVIVASVALNAIHRNLRQSRQRPASS